LGHPYLTTGQKNGQNNRKTAAESAEEDNDGQGHYSFMVSNAQVWSSAYTVQQVPGSGAAVQCFNSKQ